MKTQTIFLTDAELPGGTAFHFFMIFKSSGFVWLTVTFLTIFVRAEPKQVKRNTYVGFL